MTKFQKIFSAVSLLAAAVITVATSKATDPTTYDFGAASNCANATTTNQAITVTEYGFITSPEGMAFTDLGIPKTTLVVANETTVSGTITGGLTRVCTYSLNTTSGTLHVYSCSDNSNPVCQVTFTPQ